MITAFCSLLILQQVQPVFLYRELRYRPATNRNIRTWLVHVSSRTDLSIIKKKIIGDEEEMDLDAEEDSKENEWTCDIWVSRSRVAEVSSLVQMTLCCWVSYS